MPRPRLPANSTLPPRVQAVTGKRGGVRYYYRAAGGRKIALGSDPNTMRVKWAEIENGGRSSPGTFEAAWLAYKKAHFPKIAPRTRKDYEAESVPLLKVFGPHRLDAIEPHHVRKYLDARGEVAKVRANREKALLSSIFNWARENDLTSAPNPCAGVKRHTEAPRERYVTDAELRAVLEKADAIVRDAIEIAYHAGQRPADVLKAKRQDVQEGCLRFRQAKTGAMVPVRLVGRLAAVVEAILTRSRKVTGAYLVQDDNGQPLTYWQLRTRFDAAREAAGVSFQFRDLRAKAGTDMRRAAGWDAAQGLLGHAEPGTTKRYIRARDGDAVDPVEFGTSVETNGTSDPAKAG